MAEHLSERLANLFLLIKEKNPHKPSAANLVFSGGVSANQYLRGKLEQSCNKAGYQLCTTDLSLCTDNALMIAWAGYEQFLLQGASHITFDARSRWPLTMIS